jgi:hypothetical protein
MLGGSSAIRRKPPLKQKQRVQKNFEIGKLNVNTACVSAQAVENSTNISGETKENRGKE